MLCTQTGALVQKLAVTLGIADWPPAGGIPTVRALDRAGLEQ